MLSFSICGSLFWAIRIILIEELSKMEIDLQVLEEILSLRKLSHLKSLMSTKAKQHLLSQKQLINTSKRDAVNLARRLNQRSLLLPPQKRAQAESWMWREQKLFVWITIYYAQAILSDVNALTQLEFQKIIALFPSKEESFLRYEYTLTFLVDSDFNSIWTEDEVSLLQQIYSQSQSSGNHWKNISYQMFKRSAGSIVKSAESCRNRWENHSNPTLKKGAWTAEEDISMAQCIMENGTKWAAVGKKACVGRTEHMIKNRYRCLIKRLQINQKETSVRQACQRIIQMATLRMAEGLQEENSAPAYKESQKASEEEERWTDSKIYESWSLVDMHQEQGSMDSPEKKLQVMSASEIMREVHLKEFGENHKYMRSLDDCWIDLIMESQPIDDDILDIYCS